MGVIIILRYVNFFFPSKNLPFDSWSCNLFIFLERWEFRPNVTPSAHESLIFVGQNRLRIVKQQSKSLENVAEFVETQSELGERSAAPCRLCRTPRHYRGGEHFYFKFLLQMQPRGDLFLFRLRFRLLDANSESC